MMRWSSPYFIGVSIAAAAIALALIVLNWSFVANLFQGTSRDGANGFTPTTPEEKLRILESLPPVENPLSAEEKRAILENLPAAR